MSDSIEQKLGFDRIRQMVAERCSNALAVRMAEEMTFMTDHGSLCHELQLVEEMQRIVLMGEGFPQQDYIDLTPILARLRVGNTFIPLEALQELKLSLRTIRDCYRFLTEAHEHQTGAAQGAGRERSIATDGGSRISYPALAELAIGIELGYGGTSSQLNVINSLLGKLVDEKGELYDNASPALAEIRRTRARKAAEVEAQVSSALARAKREGWAPADAEATIRDGRPVIPLLTTHRRRMRGLIQDESASRQTAFVEPAEVVELGNDLRELDFDERHEVQRILLQFSERLRPLLPQLDEAYRFLARLDFLRAKVRVGMAFNGCVPQVVAVPMMDWVEARHPLLCLQKGDEVVPFSLRLGSDDAKGGELAQPPTSATPLLPRILIISGPNAGGKSVCLKAVGLIQYMLQCGVPVPLRPTSECGIFTHISIDIGDQQSIDNDLSTYTSHLRNMKELLAEADGQTLFLLDELGGGTEPRSGCAIAEAVLEELYERGSFGVVTTHFADLKLLADRLPAVANGAMLFDTDAMRPLYRLQVGLPGSSFAFEIAESVGIPTSILQRAGQKVGVAQLNFEHQLQQLELDKKAVEQKQQELRVADELLYELTQKYQRMSDELQARRREIVGAARHEAQQILAEANRTVERTISDIKSAHAEREATKQARVRLAEAVAANDALLAENARKAEAPRLPESGHQADVPTLPITEGTIVRIDGQDSFGQVVEVKGKKAVVESNSIRMTIALDRLTATAKRKLPSIKGGASKSKGIYSEMNDKRALFNPTLDLRGQRADEAAVRLHRFLDDALLLGEKEVRILHGKGYGILMQVVREQLRNSRNVRSFRPERVELGGEGITVVELH